MRATIKAANVRGVEAKTNKKGEGYLLIRIEDSTGAPCRLVDKDMDRKVSYQRDAIVDIDLDIDEGRNFTSIRVVGVSAASK